ncbi:MAG: ATP-binding protein [Verrucomicrobiota bacterium]
MNDSLKEKLLHLRLNRLAAHWEEDLKEAARQRMSHAALLTHVIEEEYRVKCDNARQQRLKRARIPEPWTIETYPFARQPKLNRKEIMALYDTMDFIAKGQNIVWLGRTGCGKTGLATGFLIRAIQQGYSGRYVLFAELIAELYRSVADHSETRALKPYLRCDVLHIDSCEVVSNVELWWRSPRLARVLALFNSTLLTGTFTIRVIPTSGSSLDRIASEPTDE